MPITEYMWDSRFGTVLVHVITSLILFGFSYYLYLRSKKTPLLYSFLSIAAMILLWLVSKIFKTVSPNVSLRWFFVVTQYIGVELLGVALIAFAYLYAKKQRLSNRTLLFLSIPPLLGLLIIVTNPLHMSFYSRFDYYRTRFGPLFYVVQAMNYVYVVVGVWLLAKNYTRQPGLKERKHWAYVLAAATLFPLCINLYYVAFKTDLVPWVLPFRVFDITPITITMSLVLFIYPSIKFRFFDIAPISRWQVFQESPQGLAFVNQDHVIYGVNSRFRQIFPDYLPGETMAGFSNKLPWRNPEDSRRCQEFLYSPATDNEHFVLYLQDAQAYRILRSSVDSTRSMLVFTDISLLDANQTQLQQQHAKLQTLHEKLGLLAERKRQLALTRARSLIAQNVHDILGHSLTTAIARAELAAAEENPDRKKAHLHELRCVLGNSIADLEANSGFDRVPLPSLDLKDAILQFQSTELKIDLVIQGEVCDLTPAQTEAIYRCVQEATTNSIRHGQAKTLHVILRYTKNRVDLFAIDDGVGCPAIAASYGLTGIGTRFANLSGNVRYGSDGEKGFSIHGWFPTKNGGTPTVYPAADANWLS